MTISPAEQGEMEARRQAGAIAEAQDEFGNVSAAARLVALAEAHAEMDDYVQGTYRVQDIPTYRGCSIGCTINDAKELGLLPDSIVAFDHSAVAGLLFGGVEPLAQLQDCIFERLPDGYHLGWTPRILRAVATAGPDADWSRVYHRWITGTMENLMDVVRGNQPLWKSVRLARDLNARVVAGLPVTHDEWHAAYLSIGESEKAGDHLPRSWAGYAYSAAECAASEVKGAHGLCDWSNKGGVGYVRMADLLIDSIMAR